MAAFNAPWPPRPWGRFLVLHGAGALLFWGLHVLGMWGLRTAIYRVAGWGAYDYGDLWYRAPMEGGKDLLGFALLAFLFHAWEARRLRQQRELAVARLEAELREARLQALAAQLDPHFLFNALNTLSSVMYEDVGRADRLLSALGLMLRDALRSSGPTWTLARELEHQEHILAFTAARFGDRVRATVEADPGLGAAEVPRYALQRLVENAVKHNGDRPGRPLHVAVRARRGEGGLRLEVEDDGAGFPAQGANGVGLENLRASLALLYGGGGALAWGNGPAGGGRVVVTLPAEPAHG
jgi:LytS/YehU family sensor histidine kinase